MKTTTTLLLFLVTFVSLAQSDQASTDPLEVNQAEAESKLTQNKSKPIDENFKKDMQVVFGKKSPERISSEQEFTTWGIELNQFLMDSGDSLAQALTLAKMITSLDNLGLTAKINEKRDQLDALNDLSYQPFADTLNQLISQDNLSTEAFDVLTGICFHKQLKDYCHANVLLKKRMQQDTANLQSYLRPFALAFEANQAKTMQQLIQLMAASEFSQTFWRLPSSFNALVDSFIADNPLPQSASDNMVSDFKKLSGISPTKKKQLAVLMPDYMPAHIKVSYKYMNDLPPYQPVLKYCQTYINMVPHCRKIAQTMIQKSNSMIDKALGHTILIATFELERDQVGIKSAVALNQQFRESHECIRELSKDPYFIDSYFDPEYQKITETAADEFEMSIQLAEYRYRNLKTQGDESAKNPDSCFKEPTE